MDKVSVIIVDDHKLFREGMKLILSNLDYIGNIHEAGNGREFLDFIIGGGWADIVFMDIEMPVMDGVEATREAQRMKPGLNIVALSMYAEEGYYTRMIEAGARGFILKNSGIKEVEEAIGHIRSGQSYFSQEILSGLIRSISRRDAPKNPGKLSEREEEVLYLICKGLSNQEIADNLHISKRTVDKHRENLLSKTLCHNTAGLVIYAIKNGIIEI